MQMHNMEGKTFNKPDETRTFPLGKVELVQAGELTFGKATLEPGWKWSESVKPIAKTELCMAPHTQFQLSGKIHVVMEDGTEMEYKSGDVAHIPPGHNAWVVGDEQVVIIDVTGMEHYAKKKDL